MSIEWKLLQKGAFVLRGRFTNGCHPLSHY